MKILYLPSEVYIGLVVSWAKKRSWRVFFATAIHALIVLAIAVWLWRLESNLWVFASTVASKVLAGIVLIGGWGQSLGVMFSLGTQNQFEEHFWSARPVSGDSNVQAFHAASSATPGDSTRSSAENPSEAARKP